MTNLVYILKRINDDGHSEIIACSLDEDVIDNIEKNINNSIEQNERLEIINFKLSTHPQLTWIIGLTIEDRKIKNTECDIWNFEKRELNKINVTNQIGTDKYFISVFVEAMSEHSAYNSALPIIYEYLLNNNMDVIEKTEDGIF